MMFQVTDVWSLNPPGQVSRWSSFSRQIHGLNSEPNKSGLNETTAPRDSRDEFVSVGQRFESETESETEFEFMSGVCVCVGITVVFVFVVIVCVCCCRCPSPRRARRRCCSGWRRAKRPPPGRCTTAARWDSWRCRSRWCPAVRGRCPGSRCPVGPNTPPPAHTEGGNREEGRVSQTAHQRELPGGFALFQTTLKCSTFSLKLKQLEVAIAAGRSFSQKPTCVTPVTSQEVNASSGAQTWERIRSGTNRVLLPVEVRAPPPLLSLWNKSVINLK